MSVNKTLEDIPVVVERRKPSNKLHWQRRIFQLTVLALLVVVPLSGLFRIDPIQGAFVILDRQIWFSDFGIVFGLWLAGACLMAMMYSVLGTVFCGWACPQNTISEWANKLTFKLLGKRAEVSLDGTPMQVAPSKNNVLNWFVLVGLCMVISAGIALIPLLYFYEPAIIWNFVSFQHDSRLAPSLHWIYTIFFLVMFINITMIRHFMCRFMCIYKVWQHTFKTRQTLHVAYDDARSDECEKCSYCTTSCFLGIDPRKTDVYDTCINCGECITACDGLQARKGGDDGLLKFAMGERKGQDQNAFKTNLNDLFSRVTWSFPIFLLGVVMFAWGLVVYERYHVSVYRADTIQGSQILDYRISLANKFYETTQLHVEVDGLEPDQFTLERKLVEFDTAGRLNVVLSVSDDLPKGLYPVVVRVHSDNGWQDSFRVQHFSAGGL
ncbi:4Fe-4S binding protein [Pseudomonadota bacterium]